MAGTGPSTEIDPLPDLTAAVYDRCLRRVWLHDGSWLPAVRSGLWAQIQEGPMQPTEVFALPGRDVMVILRVRCSACRRMTRADRFGPNDEWASYPALCPRCSPASRPLADGISFAEFSASLTALIADAEAWRELERRLNEDRFRRLRVELGLVPGPPSVTFILAAFEAIAAKLGIRPPS